MKESPNNPRQFARDVAVPLKRTKELFERREIHGKVEIELDNLLLNDVALELYDGFGFAQRNSWAGATKLQSTLSLSLPEILKRRPYYPQRSVSIVGVEPSAERIADIVRALNDTGIVVDNRHSIGDLLSVSSRVILDGRREGPLGVTEFTIVITGRRSHVRRELRSGARTDNKQLPSGVIDITFYASTEESHVEVVTTLNEVIDNIRRRFAYLRVE